ncbi:uncharacterized protein AFUA_1G05660 [Aspergillus fumigatus Af293]|uniref:Uncharacterized protein n=1 Tax=Aspergillus fumigatus (strain ATCC MYA-4609 / CBS 101355 / FGSC A1100 / Af293) TaxID=330879 RepID=Q4WJK5_ASPFU|nr:conserved hypothetical protein [Aspergillus fumigatus Af293]EAL88277.1 conserved hypothetical protein [Aspergillus fumigatus Af293]
MDQPPLSPPAEPESISTANLPSNAPVPLDSPLRTNPIHPSLPDIRVPGSPLRPYQYDPVTCTPIDLESDSFRTQLDHLRTEYATPSAALKAQEQVAKEAKRKIEEAEKKREEVQKAMDKKVKERDTEMKVLSKYQKSGTALRTLQKLGGSHNYVRCNRLRRRQNRQTGVYGQHNTAARSLKYGLMGK